ETIVNSYAPLTADGMMNRRNLRRFRCSAPDAMSTVASATPGHQFLLTTSQACVGSVAPAKNGTRDRASTSPMMRLTTGWKNTKRPTKHDCCEAQVAIQKHF